MKCKKRRYNVSIYRCESCNDYYDADMEGIEEHPRQELVCVCESCYEKLISEELIEI